MTVPHEATDWPWKIPLRARDGTVRAYALVDREDYERINTWRWSLNPKGHAQRAEWVSSTKCVSHRMHRVVLQLAKRDAAFVDHRNGDTLDNRRSNLRLATPRLSAQNQGSRGGTSRHRGVCWRKDRQQWSAQVKVDGRQHHLGMFDDEDTAAEAAVAFRREHMPFAVDR